MYNGAHRKRIEKISPTELDFPAGSWEDKRLKETALNVASDLLL